MTLEQLTALEAAIATVAAAIATWRWRRHWYDGPFMGAILWVVGLLGVVGFSARSFLEPELALLVVSVVRGLYILAFIALAWEGPPDEGEQRP
jgi:hypothetical protein